jgi:enoyl-CoA hydratase/carnithine racemase
VDWKEKRYRLKIVDTIGIGDTDLGHDEVLGRLARACYECREGINAVYFVTGGRFTAEEADAWELLWKVLFDPSVIDYITLVSSKFPHFMNPDAVQTDGEKLKAQKGAARRIMPNVKTIVHVDNPPSIYEGWKETREKSRLVLMEHLSRCEHIYRPPELEEVNERISTSVEEKRAADEAAQVLVIELEKARHEKEKIQVEMQRQIAEVRERAAQAELRLVQEMNQILQTRAKMQDTGHGTAQRQRRNVCPVM